MYRNLPNKNRRPFLRQPPVFIYWSPRLTVSFISSYFFNVLENTSSNICGACCRMASAPSAVMPPFVATLCNVSSKVICFSNKSFPVPTKE